MPMQPWFTDAKLGIFIHWGIYAVDGVAESWSFYDGRVPYEQYMKQLNGFTAANYDPREWAALFERAGARYAVLTARHHDGVALWPNGLSVGRDLLTPYAEALRQRGLRVGFYYSHSDWSHPDYASMRHSDPAQVQENPYASAASGKEDPEAWRRYLAYRDGQVGELVRKHRPDLMWFDGEWERAEEQWGIDTLADLILAANPATVMNARMFSRGDFATPELGVPITPPDGPWELCLTINDSWGYQHRDTNHKSVNQLVRYFAETIGAGGNLLLDVGPMADGTIPPEQADRLEALGAWIARHASAIYGTVAGMPPGHHYGPSTLSKDKRTLNLFVFDIPRESIAVRGLRNRVRNAWCNGKPLGHKTTAGLHDVPGVLWVQAPEVVDDHAAVITLELDGELDLYRGAGRT